jgi:hypothetical protein
MLRAQLLVDSPSAQNDTTYYGIKTHLYGKTRPFPPLHIQDS